MEKIYLFIFSFITSTSQAHAQSSGGVRNPDPGGGVQNPDPNGVIGLKNPLNNGAGTNVDSIPLLIEKILEIVLTIGIPIIAVAIIYSGFLFIKARGKPEDLQKAKDNLLHVLIGAAILLGAYVIAETVVHTINAIRGVN